MRRPIQVGLKLDSFFCDFSERLVTKDLISSTVRQNRSLPGHETVKPTLTFDDLLSGAKIEMVGVGQDELNIQIFQKLLGHGLHRARCSDRHKNRSFDLSSPGLQHPLAGMGFLISSQNSKGKGHGESTDHRPQTG